MNEKKLKHLLKFVSLVKHFNRCFITFIDKRVFWGVYDVTKAGLIDC